MTYTRAKIAGILVGAIAALSLASCGQPDAPPPPPGSDDRIPSVAARAILGTHVGAPIRDEAVLGEGSWKLGGFSVSTYPTEDGRRTKGPHTVLVRQGDQEVRYVPLVTDGDIGELCRRVTGEWPGGLDRETSAAGRAFWKR